MKRYVASVVAVAVIGLVAGGCGNAGSSSGAARTVDIEMRDIEYQPNQVQVKAGETVRFVFNNRGKVAHDAFIGDQQAQMDHEKEMGASMAGMSHGGGGITVEPGKTATLTQTFRTGDQMLIGCHEPGHYAAGMKVVIAVG